MRINNDIFHHCGIRLAAAAVIFRLTTCTPYGSLIRWIEHLQSRESLRPVLNQGILATGTRNLNFFTDKVNMTYRERVGFFRCYLDTTASLTSEDLDLSRRLPIDAGRVGKLRHPLLQLIE